MDFRIFEPTTPREVLLWIFRKVGTADRAYEKAEYMAPGEAVLRKVGWEVVLPDQDYKAYTSNLMVSVPFLGMQYCGYHEGVQLVVEVRNADTGEKLYLDCEGYDYAKYVGVNAMLPEE